MIEKDEMERLREIFVTRRECDETTTDLRDKIDKESADIAVIKFQCRVILTILSAIGGAVLTLVVKQFWG